MSLGRKNKKSHYLTHSSWENVREMDVKVNQIQGIL